MSEKPGMNWHTFEFVITDGVASQVAPTGFMPEPPPWVSDEEAERWHEGREVGDRYMAELASEVAGFRTHFGEDWGMATYYLTLTCEIFERKGWQLISSFASPAIPEPGPKGGVNYSIFLIFRKHGEPS